MSFLAQYPGRWAVGILTLGSGYLYLSRPAAPRDESPIGFKTAGVASIENAYSNAGATPTHTPAYGGTPMGNKENVGLKDSSGTGSKNKKSPTEQEGMGSDQRPQGTKIEEAFAQTNLGSTKGMYMITRLRSMFSMGVLLLMCSPGK